jgi:predicted  nucleic acid-binding Zn-ribbon protein
MNPTTPERPWLPIGQMPVDETVEVEWDTGAITIWRHGWDASLIPHNAFKILRFRPLPSTEIYCKEHLTLSTETGEREGKPHVNVGTLGQKPIGLLGMVAPFFALQAAMENAFSTDAEELSTKPGERECIFGDSWDTVPPTAADRKRCGCRRCLSTKPAREVTSCAPTMENQSASSKTAVQSAGSTPISADATGASNGPADVPAGGEGQVTPPDAREAAKAALHKIRSCCGSVHDERNLVDRLAIEALAVIDSLPDAEQLRAENEELKSRLKEQGATLLAFVESPAGDLKITSEKLETANRVCAELEDEVKRLNQECTDYVDCISRHTRVGEALTAERDALRKEVEEAKRQYERLRGAVNGTVAADLEYTDAVAKENEQLRQRLSETEKQRDEARAAHDAEVKRADELAEQLGVARVALAEATSGHLIAELHRQIDSHKATINSLSAALTAAQQAAREDGQ